MTRTKTDAKRPEASQIPANPVDRFRRLMWMPAPPPVYFPGPYKTAADLLKDVSRIHLHVGPCDLRAPEYLAQLYIALVELSRTYPQAPEPPQLDTRLTDRPAFLVQVGRAKAWLIACTRSPISADTRESPRPLSGVLDADKSTPPVLSAAQRDILRHLNQSEAPVKQSAIAESCQLGDGTTKTSLLILEHLGLVNRPLGPRGGYRITAAGRQRIATPR